MGTGIMFISGNEPYLAMHTRQSQHEEWPTVDKAAEI